ncbi:MAG: CvpA family protein [Pirellulales bacterium]|nr:CvpA family protein [Pirellulales bacterium]
MALTIIFAVVILAVVASSLNEGVWGNFLTLCNVVFAALLAVNFWEPVGKMLAENMKVLRYAADFIALWLVFGVSMFVLRAATDALSRVKLKFPPPIDKGLGVATSLVTAWVMVCFLAMTLHTAPLPRRFLWDSFVAEQPLFLQFWPDRLMLGFSQRMSRTVFSPLTAEGEDDCFDPRAEYMIKYASQRQEYEFKSGFGGT